MQHGMYCRYIGSTEDQPTVSYTTRLSTEKL